MLHTEAVIAWIIGAAFLSYSIVKHLRNAEGIGLMVVVWGFVLFVCIPLTLRFVA